MFHPEPRQEIPANIAAKQNQKKVDGVRSEMLVQTLELFNNEKRFNLPS